RLLGLSRGGRGQDAVQVDGYVARRTRHRGAHRRAAERQHRRGEVRAPGTPRYWVLISSFSHNAAGVEECTMVPWCMTWVWSDTSTANAAFCSTSRIVVPS